MSLGVSIVICCYNSALRLPETLKYISLQQCNIFWEVIVVNNNSTDDTKQVAISEWEKIGSSVSLTLVDESIPSLSAARAKGIETSKFDYLIFCDDDNWLAPNYVNDVYEIFESNDTIGIVGGNGTPVTEIEPPIWFEKFIHSYAAFPQSDESRFLGGVYGAGMALRRKYYLNLVEAKFTTLLTDRKGSVLSSGGDSEFCYHIRFSGYKIWYDARLKFQHFIPENRLTWDYLKKLHIGLAKSYVVINLYEKSINTSKNNLTLFYWVKKAFYYLGIYLKYWPKHYRVYKKGIGSTEEIHHITWSTIGLDYLKYNFRTIKYYKKIIALKVHLNGKR